MYAQFLLFYNGEEIDQLTPGEEKSLSETLTSSRRPASIKWKGNTVETRRLVIRKKNSAQNAEVDNERNNYLRDWEERQKVLEAQTPAEKTFRNYKCMFTWRYLLQYGFTNFFETEAWKKEMPYDTFKRFDKLIYEKKPKMMKVFVEVLEKYFIENPKEIWCDGSIITRFLPRGDVSSKSLILKGIQK